MWTKSAVSQEMCSVKRTYTFYGVTKFVKCPVEDMTAHIAHLLCITAHLLILAMCPSTSEHKTAVDVISCIDGMVDPFPISVDLLIDQLSSASLVKIKPEISNVAS